CWRERCRRNCHHENANGSARLLLEPLLDASMRSGKTEPIAQRAALVLRAEQAATLQLRHDECREVFETRRQQGRHHVEAVGGTLLEPELQLIRNSLCSPDQCQMTAAAGNTQIQLANRQTFAACEIREQLLTAALT